MDYRLPPDISITERLVPLSETKSWADDFLGIEDAWRESRGKGVIVAVLDTGIDAEHPDLRDAVLDAWDFTGSRFGPQDVNNHGTHVSSLIGARAGNDLGIRGIAPECKLLHAKVLGDNGAGDENAIVEGLNWAFGKGADIFSLSLGGLMPMLLVQEFCIWAQSQRPCWFLGAAGNDGGRLNSPAALEQFVSVGAHDKKGMLTQFTSKVGRLDIVAPGIAMLGCLPRGRYGEMTGTSQATPCAAAVAALMVSKHRESGSDTDLKTTADLREHFQKSATDRGTYRLLNARKALERHGVTPAPEKPWRKDYGLGVWLGRERAIFSREITTNGGRQ